MIQDLDKKLLYTICVTLKEDNRADLAELVNNCQLDIGFKGYDPSRVNLAFMPSDLKKHKMLSEEDQNYLESIIQNVCHGNLTDQNENPISCEDIQVLYKVQLLDPPKETPSPSLATLDEIGF